LDVIFRLIGLQECGTLIPTDNFVPEEQRASLLEWLTGPGWDQPHPPPEKWERATSDGAGLPSSWGLKVCVKQAAEFTEIGV
jgi:hypothetical protein